jgi:excinuclease ABC subunit A
MPKNKYQAKVEGEKIVIKGARTHNLKNIDLEIPRNKMVIFTGLSGSGKSSLAFDTIVRFK